MPKANTIYIAMITDDNYVKPTVVTLTSLWENKKAESVYNISILTNNLNEENTNLLKSLNNSNFSINILDKSNFIEEFKNINQERHVTFTSLLKFFLPEIFNNLDKILYLDSDILVQDDLSELFNIDISDFYSAAVKDILCKVNKQHMLKYNIQNEYYFNSGVLLLNLELMRQNNTANSLIEYRINNKNHFMDQDTFNAVLGHKVKYISYKYNFLNYYLEKMSIKELEDFLESIKGLEDEINDLDSAEIIVSGGKGMKNAEGFKLLESLAKALNGAVGASRGAVEMGLADHKMQIGQTGKTVSPKLYIACGISGAIQHTVGMDGSKRIFAINTDEKAPIFDIADIGYVGDAFEIIPQLIDKLSQKTD